MTAHCISHKKKKTSFLAGLSFFPACISALGYTGSHRANTPDPNTLCFSTGQGATVLGSSLMSSKTLLTFWLPPPLNGPRVFS